MRPKIQIVTDLGSVMAQPDGRIYFEPAASRGQWEILEPGDLFTYDLDIPTDVLVPRQYRFLIHPYIYIGLELKVEEPWKNAQ